MSEKKEVLYLIAIVACSLLSFAVGTKFDGKCAAAVERESKINTQSKNKAIEAKINFCLKNRPESDSPDETLKSFRLYKELHCPERLLYTDCDEACMNDARLQVSLDIDNWANYEPQDKDDLFQIIDQENIYPEP